MATQVGIPSESTSKQLGLDVIIEDQVNEKRHQILAAIEQIKQHHKMKKDNLGSKFNGTMCVVLAFLATDSPCMPLQFVSNLVQARRHWMFANDRAGNIRWLPARRILICQIQLPHLPLPRCIVKMVFVVVLVNVVVIG